MTYGTVTFSFEGTEDEVQAMAEQIIDAIETLNLPVTVTEDTWEDEKTPVFDAFCGCLIDGKHRLSMHGTSPEWDAKHYWTLDASEVYNQ